LFPQYKELSPAKHKVLSSFPLIKLLVCKNIEKKAKHQRFSVSFVANKDNFTTDRCLFSNQKKNYKSIYLLLQTKKQ
jgi:hypothetical protein